MDINTFKQAQKYTFKDLSKMTGFAAGYLCEVANGKKPGSLALAKALSAISDGQIRII